MSTHWNWLFLRVLSFVMCAQVAGCGQNDHRREVEMELFVISGAIAQYDAMSGTGIENRVLTDGASMYEALASARTSKTTVRLLPPNPRWDETRRLIDPWGEDYRVEAIRRTDMDGKPILELRVTSYGPNRKSDGGSKDDLVRTTVLSRE